MYGTKKFVPVSNSIEKLSKSRASGKKGKNKKQKLVKTAQPKNQTKPKLKPYSTTTNPKNIISFNINNSFKNKKLAATFSPYFYLANGSNFASNESVKHYWKFVKNISITYPIMIPARDGGKARDPFKRIQKQKEKSRDINSNRNVKLYTPKPTEVATTLQSNTRDRPNGKS